MDGGNNGGQRYMSINRMKTNLILFKTSGCFKFMWKTAANGETVLCICILSDNSLSVTDVKGFD